MRIKGVISYDGSHYYGFQKQKQEEWRTIQGELERVLSKIMNQKIEVFGAGRTDRGVHALNQVFHFDIENERDVNKLCYSMNKLLNDDILVKSLEVVNDDFHSRFSAKGKHYRYIISLKRNPFLVNYASLWLKKIDFSILEEGMKLFLGTHDFVNFCANKDEGEGFVRTIYSFTYVIQDDKLIFDITGNGFKRYMVRMIIGTLLSLIDHQIELSYIIERLTTKEAGTTSYNAPAQGLYLMEVMYHD